MVASAPWSRCQRQHSKAMTPSFTSHKAALEVRAFSHHDSHPPGSLGEEILQNGTQLSPHGEHSEANLIANTCIKKALASLHRAVPAAHRAVVAMRRCGF
mmetsp:Transcript_18718/g.38526  ORF Transcript_18718/g.38526 Transcript_18718/m.38526 type:complete len:100 (+) Transcript_18718:353-652(+)